MKAEANLLNIPKENLWPILFDEDENLKGEVRSIFLDLVLISTF